MTQALSAEQLARMIDHTLLKPEATPAQVEQLCTEAVTHHFAAVCVNPVFIPLVAQQLAGSDVAPCSVVGFPLGATTTAAKVFETEQVVRAGATEVDMVITIGLLKAEQLDAVRQDIAEVVVAAQAGGALVKVIIEAALLTDDEKRIACQLAQQARADFVKTSTGFGTGGATVEDVRLMRRVVGAEMGVKAAGGIRTYQTALAMIEAGATRIGASAGVQIVGEAPKDV